MSLSKFHGGSSSSATACAACKYQRKKCTENCILARYFAQEKQNQFLNAHKLFGVSNITKFIKGVEECQRDVAMNNLIFHANARARDPVLGVFKIMLDLKHQIACAQAELNFLHQKLATCQTLALQQQLACYSYGDLLEQGDQYLNIDGHVHQEIMQKQSPLNYEMFMEMPIKLEKEKISIPGHKNAVNQIAMPSQVI
ncbi:LOB domain-containing protein 7 [Raphanus sativus]|uniref:LOB domain-containing protein 7 n=1 Tax=Raphanus sativus TaxID=3726 RepID=A0A6J0MBT2_RAPSA|nr:LOB domain-containing protein 7 [Raphanus sativus]KAJ4909403.1 LOB domain-containing protein 7 [Raphanus sativus]